jgi:hypothetical protein
MSLHLIKLCVGCESVKDLREWIAANRERFRRMGGNGEHFHVTRMTPKRTEELLNGGSLYWVIKSRIACRQRLLSISDFTDHEGISRCRLGLDPEVVLVAPRLHHPFQGWRYFPEEQVPKDVVPSEGDDELPDHLKKKLADLGLL